MSEFIGQLINWQKKNIGNYFDEWKIVSVMYSIQNILWFQCLKCEDLLFFFAIFDCKLNIFGFWNKTSLREMVMGIFHYFLTFL